MKEPSAKYLARPRNQQTEVGSIPEDWEVVSASSACSKIQDGTHFSPKVRGGDYLYVTSKNIRFGSLDLSTAGRIDAAQHQAIYRRCDVKKGDLLLTKDGANTGNAALNTINEEFSLLSSVAFLRFHPNKHCAAYFLQQVLTSRGQRQIQDAMAGNAITRLTLEKINKLLFPAPTTKAEQEAIAEALSDADFLIESLEQLLAKKRQIKQGAMQELLTGKRRLPGFSEMWVAKRLENTARIRSGGTPSTLQPQFWDGDIPWCTPTDITALSGYKYLSKTSRTISQRGLEASSAELIPANSIVMTSRATIGECAINRIPVATNQGFKNFVPAETIDVEFLYYLLLTQRQGFTRLCGGSTFLEIGKGQLAAYEVRLPASKAEQSAIAAILSSMDAEISELEEKLDKVRQVKQGMMQELLTGRIRLIQPEANVVHLPTRVESVSVSAKSHNWEINEAVVIAVLAKKFGTERFPLGRKRCTKLAYLLHRHVERAADGYLKKAAGPYNPAVKYKGPERIAQKNRYVRPHRSNQYTGFVAGENIAQAEAYFAKWYGDEPLTWLEQFRLRTNDELELLATVEMALVDLRNANKAEQLADVKKVIRDHPEWEAKLDRAIFSDDRIVRAIKYCQKLFGSEG